MPNLEASIDMPSSFPRPTNGGSQKDRNEALQGSATTVIIQLDRKRLVLDMARRCWVNRENREGAGDMRFKRAHVLGLGIKIRTLREARHWSLSRLSKNSGISVPAIQKIEAGRSNPSLVTIVAIIDALGASVDKLISEVRQLDHGVTVVRNVLQTKDGTSLPLSTDRADRRMDCRVIALSSRQKPNDVVMDKPLFGYVLDGGLRLNLSNGEALELSTGDAFHAAADTCHDWSNPLSRRSVILCIKDVSDAKSAAARRVKQ